MQNLYRAVSIFANSVIQQTHNRVDRENLFRVSGIRLSGRGELTLATSLTVSYLVTQQVSETDSVALPLCRRHKNLIIAKYCLYRAENIV